MKEEKSEVQNQPTPKQPFNSQIMSLKLSEISTNSKVYKSINSYTGIFNMDYGLPFLGIIMLSLPLFIGDAMTIYSIESMGVHNVPLAGMLMGLFELIGNLLAIFYSPLVARRNTNIICQILIFVAVSFLIIIDYNHKYFEDAFENDLSFEISQGIFCLIIRMAISFNLSTIFTYNMELFPTHLRIITLATLLFFKRLLYGISGYIILETINFHFHPVCSLFLFSVITVPLAY
ncbi:MAG: hypothetical protein AAF985_26875, partial [Bacteroidota bacterium]